MESENRGIPIICCGSFLEDKYFENARKIVNEAFRDFEERLIRLESKVQVPGTTQTEPGPTTSGGKENEKEKKDDKKEEEKEPGKAEAETKDKQSEVAKRTPETTTKSTEESTKTENAAKTKEEELKTLEEKTSIALSKADAAVKKVEKALLPFEDWAELISLHNRFYEKTRDDIVNQVLDSLGDESRSNKATTLHFEEITLEEDNFEAIVDVSGIPKDKIHLDVMDNIIEVSASHTEITALGTSTKRINKRYQLPRNVDDTSLTSRYDTGGGQRASFDRGRTAPLKFLFELFDTKKKMFPCHDKTRAAGHHHSPQIRDIKMLGAAVVSVQFEMSSVNIMSSKRKSCKEIVTDLCSTRLEVQQFHLPDSSATSPRLSTKAVARSEGSTPPMPIHPYLDSPFSSSFLG
uniref:SHSP domain-containing protein n=1 Tax=Timema cristinae TaxID=61476 RepID=A0A7R9GYB2_TIMCR|nr:unnamed protein product [Timema cristinae]